jgi:hypothetical protein
MKTKWICMVCVAGPLALTSGAASGNTFICKGPLANAIPFKVTATAAEGLIVETDHPTYYGPVDMSGATYDARREVTENGGTVTSHWVIDRITGEFTFEMHTNLGVGPINLQGHCEGVDPPAGTSSAGSSPSESVGSSSSSEPVSGSAGSSSIDSEPSTPAATDQAISGEADDSGKMEAEARRLEEEARAAREKADAAKREREATIAREKAEADRLKLQAEEERKRKEEEERSAREKAKADADRLAVQQRRRDERMLRETFNGQATSCPGGGTGIFYLRSSKPPRLGCNVTFEARCVGTASGAVVNFGQNNYIGSSCLGIGDAIRIGQMACPAEQVQIQMTSANCGG